MKILSLYNGEQLSLADLIYVASDTPRQGQQDITHGLLAPNGPRILRGFVASFAQGKVTVGPGSGLLNFKQGNTLTKGLIVAEDAAAQTVDVSAYAQGTYGLYVTFNSLPSDMAERSIYQSDGIGFTQDSVVNTRFSAAWTLVVKAEDPGEAYVQVATLSLPDGALTDTRPLLFEGRAQDQFAPTWGTDADRDAARGNAPISDLETMIAALKVAIEDIKGARWYEKVGADGGGGGGGGTTPGTLPDDFTANSLILGPVAGDTNPVQLTLQNASQNPVFRVDADGNTQVAGTLQSGGLATLASLNAGSINTATLTVNDRAQFKAGIDVLGAATLGSLQAGNASFTGNVSVSDLTTGSITAQDITSLGGITGKDLTVTRNTVLAVTQTGSLQVGAAGQPSPINAYGPLTVRGETIAQDVDAQNVTARSLNVDGNTLLEGTLTVEANATVDAMAVRAQRSATALPLQVSDADNQDLFTVDNEGDVVIKGTLVVSGAQTNDATNAGALTATSFVNAGTTRLDGDLRVNGATTLQSASATDLAAQTGHISQTLAVDGDTMLTTLTATDAQLRTLNVAQGTILQGALTVGGTTQTQSLDAATISTTGGVSVGTSLSVSARSTLADVTAHDVHAHGLVVDGAVLLGSDVQVAGRLSGTDLALVVPATGTDGKPFTIDTADGTSLLSFSDDGSLVISGNLTVNNGQADSATNAGALTASSFLDTGNAHIQGTLLVDGQTTLAATTTQALQATTLAASGAATFGQSVDVDGALTTSSTKSYAITVVRTPSATDGTLDVAGITHLHETFATTLTADSLTVSGNASITGDAVFKASVGITGPLSVTAATTLGALSAQAITGQTLSLTGAAQIAGGVQALGSTSLAQLTVQVDPQNPTTTPLVIKDKTGKAVATFDDQGDLTLIGTLTLSGGQTGQANNLGAITVTSLVDTGDAKINGKLTVLGLTALADLTANTTTLGQTTTQALSSTTLSVSGNAQLAQALTVGTTLGVTGLSTLGSVTAQDVSAQSLATTLGASIGTTLSVGGKSTLANVQASAINAASITTTGNAAFGGTLNATGATSLAASLSVLGAATLASSLSVSGNATVPSLSVTLPQNNASNVPITLVNAQGTTLFSVDNQGNVVAKGSVTGQAASGPTDLTVTSLTDTGALTVQGLSTLAGLNAKATTVTTLSATGLTTLGAALQVTGATTLGAALSVTAGIGAQSLLLALPSTNAAAKPIVLNDSAGNALFTVDSSGNVVAKGTVTAQTSQAPTDLTVSSLTDTGALTVQGASTLAGTLVVSGLTQLKASAVVTGTLSVSGAAQAASFATSSIGNAGTPAFGFGSSGIYFNNQYGQMLESIAGYTSRAISYTNGPPADVGAAYITHNFYTAVDGARDAYRFYVRGNVVGLRVLGTGGVTIASDSSVAGVTTTAGLTLSSGVVTFADGTTQSTAPVSANPGSAAKFSATNAGTATSPAFNFTGATGGSGLYFDATPGNVLVAVNGAKSLFSTAATGAASGANGWAIQSTLGAGSNLLALYGAASTTTPVLTIDGVGKVSGQSVSVTGSVAAASLTISGPSSVAAVTATGTVTAANLTLASGGTLTFADGTTQTTAGGGGSAGPAASYSATAPGSAASPAFKYASANNGSGVYFDGAAGNVLVSANGAKTLFTRAANGAAVGASGVGIASTLGTGAQVLGVYGNGVDSTVPANAQFAVDGLGQVSTSNVVLTANGKLTFADGTTLATAPAGNGTGAFLGAMQGPTAQLTTATALSATPTVLLVPNSSTTATYTPAATSYFLGGTFAVQAGTAVFELYDQTAGTSLYKSASFGAGSVAPLGPFPAAAAVTGGFPMTAGNTVVWRVTGTGNAVLYINPIYYDSVLPGGNGLGISTMSTSVSTAAQTSTYTAMKMQGNQAYVNYIRMGKPAYLYQVTITNNGTNGYVQGYCSIITGTATVGAGLCPISDASGAPRQVQPGETFTTPVFGTQFLLATANNYAFATIGTSNGPVTITHKVLQ